MTARAWFVVVAATAIGWGAGWAIAGASGSVIGAVLGLVLGAVAVRIQMRVAVSLALIGSLAIGAIIGQGVVHALCLPSGCRTAESLAAVVTGIAALIAMGLVVALVTRSFEEYHEAIAARRPPPEPGCETNEVESDTR